MTRLFPPIEIANIGTKLFVAAGAGEAESCIASESLITSSLMGHDSHGVLRIPEYLGFLADGRIVPRAELAVDRTSQATAIVDCGQGFGAVGARHAIELGVTIAREQKTASIITRRCNHVGRLGAYVHQAADSGMIALATCNSPVYGHDVLPFGGCDGRLGTNPIAYAVPTGGDPIVADFSTSVAPEGKIRFARNEGKAVPDGWILNANGQPTNDPNAFYGPPRGGILPLGGSAGHKGFALSLLVEILGSVLSGVGSQDKEVFGNGVCFIVIDPTAFLPLADFRRLMDETVAYMKSARPAPGLDEVLVPGELEFRTMRQRERDGIPVDDSTLTAMRNHAGRLRMEFPDF